MIFSGHEYIPIEQQFRLGLAGLVIAALSGGIMGVIIGALVVYAMQRCVA